MPSPRQGRRRKRCAHSRTRPVAVEIGLQPQRAEIGHLVLAQQERVALEAEAAMSKTGQLIDVER
jgi:hypothetical protein